MKKETVIGLDKIYLHHSVYPNKTTMIACDGHHNSSGRNGSGKTTLQKLIPIFYGEKVGRVVPALGTKDSFIKYYLKSEASFIAFEYTNATGKCCVVLHKKNDHLFYRFMKGALTEFFFTEETKSKLQQGKLIHEFIKDLKSEGHPISQNISTTDDYRAILQNDKNLLRIRRQTFKNILDLARDYSLPGFNSNMQLMHKLTYALQTRTSMFSGLEDMIVSTQFDFFAPEKPKHVDNKSLTDDLKSLHDFSANEEKIRQCIQKSHQRMQAEIETLRLARKLSLVYDQELIKSTELQSEISSIENNYQIALAEVEEGISVLTHKLSKDEADNQQLERQINTIHDDRDVWDNECNIQYKKNQYDQLDVLKQAFNEAEEHYQDLVKGISAEKNVLDIKKSKIKEETAKKERLLDQKIDSLKQKVLDFKDEIDLKKQTASDDRDKSIAQKESDYRPKREAMIKQLSAVEERAKSASNTDEELTELALAEQQLHESLNNEELVQDELKGLNSRYADKLAHFQKNESSLLDSKGMLTKAKEKEESIRKQRFPDSKSLISFLRREKPEWAKTIGKVIAPSLLHDTNLQPEIFDDLESLYGVSINLSKVPVPEYASNEETLSQLHSQAEDEVERLENYVEKKGDELLKIQKEVKDAEQVVQQHELRLKQIRNAKQASQTKLEQVRTHNQKKCLQRANLAKTEMVRLDKHIKDLEQSFNDSLMQIRESYKNYENELQGLIASKQSEINASVHSFENKKQELAEEAKTKLQEVKQAFKKVCEDKGLDECVELAAKKRLDRAKKTYEDAEDSVVEIQKYEAWLKNQWGTLSDLESRFSRGNQRISQYKSDIYEKNTKLNNLKRETKNKVKELKVIKSDLDELLSDATSLLDEVGTLDSGNEQSSENDLFKLIELLRSELKDYKKLTNETVRDVRRAQTLIEKRQESRVYEQWMNIFRPYEAKSQYDDYDDAFLLNLPPLFEDLLDNHLPQIRQSTLEAIIAVSGQIDNYYQELKNISAEISTVSTRLSNQIKTNQKIDALSEISIRLLSKVEEIGAWQEMESFHKVWSKYSGSVDRELPPEELGESLSAVVEALEYAHSKPDLKSMISLVVTLKENGNYKEINSDKAMNDSSSNGLSLLAVIAIYIGMSRYLCPDPNVSLTWPVDELSTIDLENISSLFNMLDKANIRLFSAFPTKEHNILKHFDICHELDFSKGAMTMRNELPQIDRLTEKLMASAEAM